MFLWAKHAHFRGGTRNGNTTKETQGFYLWDVFVLFSAGEDEIPPMWHKNRRSSHNPHRQVRFTFKDIELKLRHVSRRLFRNEKTFHIVNSNIWMAKLPEASELLLCRLLILLPVLYQQIINESQRVVTQPLPHFSSTEPSTLLEVLGPSAIPCHLIFQSTFHHKYLP